MQQNDCVEALDLRSNSIEEIGARALAEALQHSGNLLYLELHVRLNIYCHCSGGMWGADISPVG